MRRNLKFFHIWHMCDMENVSTYVQFMLFCCKIGFVAIYTLLLRNLFCRNLRTFEWRKIEPKIAYVEKKMTNMSYAQMSSTCQRSVVRTKSNPPPKLSLCSIDTFTAVLFWEITMRYKLECTDQAFVKFGLVLFLNQPTPIAHISRY